MTGVADSPLGGPVSEPALELNGLSVRHVAANDAELTGDVSFELRSGDTLAIVGESGSGKSLTARAIMGLLPSGLEPRGKVTIHGTITDGDPRRTAPLRGRTVALLMQDPFTILHPLRRIGTQLADGLDHRRLRGPERRAVVSERLAEVGLHSDVADRYPHQLSGGMRQRVGLACALLGDPSILIADEPTTALDATTQRDMIRLLDRLRQDRRLTLVMITHNLGLAFSVCDQALVMYAGGPVEFAQSSTLRHRPRHPYTAALLDAEPSLEHRLAGLGGAPGSVPARSNVLDRCAFADRCPHCEPACTETRPALTPTGNADEEHLVACRRAESIDLSRRPPAIIAEPAPAPTTTRPALEIHDLTKTFPGASQRALDRVSLRAEPGEAVAVVGESGSGKTTLARIIVGLEIADAGTVHLDGVDISDWRRLDRATKRHVRGRIQMVFQDPYSSLDPRRTVGATLKEALQAFGRPSSNRDVIALLNKVHLPSTLIAARPRSLSGGERQRVGIARALAPGPSVLIFDEAVSALDVSVQAQILSLLNELREESSITLVLITHDLAVARQTTDTMIVLRAGRTIEAGPTSRVLTEPADTYTQRLLASVPEPSGQWLSRGHEPDSQAGGTVVNRP
jgi:peptide/nickel transport system ATP-binding protein